MVTSGVRPAGSSGESINPLKDMDWDKFCPQVYQINPYPYERCILDATFKQHARRITIRASTRAGKSYTLAMVAVTRAAFYPNWPVGVIAPTYPKTRKIMDYVADLLAVNPSFDKKVMLDVEGLTRLERLRKEVSKKRITFTNGSSIHSLSADVDSKGFGVMGFAYKTILVDETDEIPEVPYTKIYRMLVEDPQSQLIEIGNPWFLGHFYKHHNDPEWVKIHIPWQECVAAGRMTQEDVEDQRKNMTNLEFQVLYDAQFPEEVEMAIFEKVAIEKMTTPRSQERYERVILGVDVARGGRDRTVITELGVSGREADYLAHTSMDTRDVMGIVGQVGLIAERYKAQRLKVEICVDSVGLGSGVADRLRELGHDCRDFVAGEAARDTTRFYNSKTEIAFRAAEAGKAGLIANIPPASKYTLQLRAWTYEVRSDRQLRILDPEDKSPDEGDSLLIALSRFIYHDDAVPRATEAAWKPRWMTNRPKDLMRAKQ